MLIIQRYPHQSTFIIVNDLKIEVVITSIKKFGHASFMASIGFDAPKDVVILRKELQDKKEGKIPNKFSELTWQTRF